MQCPKCGCTYTEPVVFCPECQFNLEEENVPDTLQLDESLISILKIMDREKARKIEQILNDNNICCKLLNFNDTAIASKARSHMISLPIEVQVLQKDTEGALQILRRNDIYNPHSSKKEETHMSVKSNNDVNSTIISRSEIVLNIMMSYIAFMVMVELIFNYGSGIKIGIICGILISIFLFGFGLLNLIKRFRNNVKSVSM